MSFPIGKFTVDSAKIGQHVTFVLSYNHNKNLEVFFPDSTYHFGPFDFIEKNYSSTLTSDSMSLDIAVYTLATFETNGKVELDLPVFIIEQEDTIKVSSSSDNLVIIKSLPVDKEKKSLLADIEYLPVKMSFNYPYWISGIVVMLMLLFLIYYFYGKTVLRNYKLYVMYTNHVNFIKSFDAKTQTLEKESTIIAMEDLLGDWKTYLTKLEQKPVNTFTSTEIGNLFNNEALQKSLNKIDRFIYGGRDTGSPLSLILELKKFANDRYKKYRKELLLNE